MELTREHWSKADGDEFKEYLLTFGKGVEKASWEQRILNTQMPCIAVPTPQTVQITKAIAKGNFLEFLDLKLRDNYNLTAINGSLICKIKDFTVMKIYLKDYAEVIDSWANCDLLKFDIKASNKEDYYALSQEYITYPKPLMRRIGVFILFKFVDDDAYIDRIFKVLNSFENETEYYVNMVNAWLFAECFIKQRAKTVEFLKTHRLNKFTINKGVQKCRDSFRVSAEDKEMLLKFKVK